MKFKSGWYDIPPYFQVHYFHNPERSVCGIGGNALMKINIGQYCIVCQRGTGRKP